MKKNIILFGIVPLVLACIAVICVCVNAFETKLTLPSEDQNSMEIQEITAYVFENSKEIQEITEHVFEHGCVPDEETAREIGHSIFEAVYGEDFDHDLPLEVQFNEEDDCWYIKSQLPENMLGGCTYMILQKSDAKVVKIWATK